MVSVQSWEDLKEDSVISFSQGNRDALFDLREGAASPEVCCRVKTLGRRSVQSSATSSDAWQCLALGKKKKKEWP